MSEVFSSKQRSLRVEAQKLLWTLFRYKNMVLVLNTITDLRDLVWDGYSTFRHCSPLDPDFQTHLCFRWDMDRGDDIALVRLWDTQADHELLSLSTRDILETCARCVQLHAFTMVVNLTFPNLLRENRGFSSFPIGLVFEKFKKLLVLESDEYTEETAEDLYITLITIQGYCNKYPYASSLLNRIEDYCCFDTGMIPSWERERWEHFINIRVPLLTEYMFN